MLCEAETRGVLEERGRVDITCDYCGRRRTYDPIDISRLLTANAVSGPDTVQ